MNLKHGGNNQHYSNNNLLRGFFSNVSVKKKIAAGADRTLVDTDVGNATCKDWCRIFENNDFEFNFITPSILKCNEMKYKWIEKEKKQTGYLYHLEQDLITNPN